VVMISDVTAGSCNTRAGPKAAVAVQQAMSGKQVRVTTWRLLRVSGRASKALYAVSRAWC